MTMWRHVVFVVFSLAVCTLADRELIEMEGCEITEVPEGTSGSLAYHYPERGGSIRTVNCTVAEQIRCNQTVDNNLLQGRTWFLTQNKAYFGQGYNNLYFQTFNVQCPPRHYLNLAFQRITRLACISGVRDTVTVTTSRGLVDGICLPNEIDASYLSGRGVILKDARARVDFCSDRTDMNFGFVLRATCFDPELAYNSVGCVSYDFFRAWDPDFVLDIDRMFDTVRAEHKRSSVNHAELYERIRQKIEEFKEIERNQMIEMELASRESEEERSKRGQERYFFSFENGTEVTYINNVLTFLFPNGTVVDFPVYCLTTSNSDYGTRVYRRNATRQTGDETGATTITFTGPGFVDAFVNSDRTSIDGFLNFTAPQPFEGFLENEGQQQQDIAKRIYDYISTQWLAPYPVVDDLNNIVSVPLTDEKGEFFPKNVRPCTQVGLVFPKISDESYCKKVIRSDVAPFQSSTIDPDIIEFCSFFQYACEPVLATVCREIMILDPYDVDLSAPMRMMGGGD